MPIKRTLATFSKTHFGDETHYIFLRNLKYFLSLTFKNIGSLLGHEIITVREGTVAVENYHFLVDQFRPINFSN